MSPTSGAAAPQAQAVGCRVLTRRQQQPVLHQEHGVLVHRRHLHHVHRAVGVHRHQAPGVRRVGPACVREHGIQGPGTASRGQRGWAVGQPVLTLGRGATVLACGSPWAGRGELLLRRREATPSSPAHEPRTCSARRRRRTGAPRRPGRRACTAAAAGRTCLCPHRPPSRRRLCQQQAWRAGPSLGCVSVVGLQGRPHERLGCRAQKLSAGTRAIFERVPRVCCVLPRISIRGSTRRSACCRVGGLQAAVRACSHTHNQTCTANPIPLHNIAPHTQHARITTTAAHLTQHNPCA